MSVRTYFCGENVRLRAVEPEDLEVLYSMENDPASWDVSNFSVPYSRYVLRQYIAESACDIYADRQLRMMIVRQTDGEVVGTIDLTDFAPMHQRGEIGIAVRQEFRRHGYAKEALLLFCDYAFGFLHLQQLTAHVACRNEASLQLFRSCGFASCGVLRRWWRVEGELLDVCLMQSLAPEAEKSCLDGEK